MLRRYEIFCKQQQMDQICMSETRERESMHTLTVK